MSRWNEVEQEIARLAESGDALYTVSGEKNTIVGYVPGDHVVVTTKKGTDGISVEHIRTHWHTLEARRRVRLRDLLRPGNRSAFMGALFRRIPGVAVEGERSAYLVLGDRPESPPVGPAP
jgi:hypothetical protein